MKSKPKSSRGGTRKGAGRPAIAPEARRVGINTSVSPKTLAWLEAQRNALGCQSIGRVLDAIAWD